MDDDALDRLESLAKLRSSGRLNDAEYLAAKARLLGQPLIDAVRPQGSSNREARPIDERDHLALIWRERFRLIDEHGMPNSRAYSKAIRSIPFWRRARLVTSPLGFILGPLYMLYLGLWRPALSLLAASIVYSLVIGMLHLPPEIDQAMWVVPSVFFAQTVIPLYYLHVRNGANPWNPFTGWRRVPTAPSSSAPKGPASFTDVR